MPPLLPRRRSLCVGAPPVVQRTTPRSARRVALLVAVAAPVCILVLQLLSAAVFGMWLLSLAALFALGR